MRILNIEIHKESGFVYAAAVGVKGYGESTQQAILVLLSDLGSKYKALKQAAHYGSLSDNGVKEMDLLRDIFEPKEDPTVAPARKK
jgi:hypothetical protein